MYENNEDVFYYMTLYNENYPMPAIPKNSEKGIIQGIYKFKGTKNADVRLIGSGPIMQQVLKANDLLKNFGIKSEIWSATSFGGVHDLFFSGGSLFLLFLLAGFVCLSHLM